jgi:hypothetical protein
LNAEPLLGIGPTPCDIEPGALGKTPEFIQGVFVRVFRANGFPLAKRESRIPNPNRLRAFAQ